MSCKWLTITQMAEHLQVSTKTIQRWIKAGKLTAMKIGDGPKPITRICAKVPNSNIMLAKPTMDDSVGNGNRRTEEYDGNSIP